MATQIQQLRQSAEEATAAYTAEFARYGEDNLPTPEQEAHVDELRTAMTTALKEVQRAEQFLRSPRAELAGMLASSNRPPTDPEERSDASNDRRSLGTRFIANPTYAEWLKAVAPNGQIPDSARGFSSPSLAFGGLRDLRRNATLVTGASSTSGGALVTPNYYPGVTELGRRPLTIRQVITNLQTDSDAIEYVRITGETNSAAAVAEATASGDGSGSKPESAMTLERVTANVKTIAHWIPATKRALADASQLRGLIDAFLEYGLDEELEDQIVAGNGSGENFTGILETSNTQSQAWDTDVFRTTRVARRKIRTVGRRIPNAFILNPEDWEIIDLKRDNQNQFYGAGPFAVTPPTLWGLPVVECEAVPAGTGLVGDFTTCVLWDREQATISASDSHSDFFTRNLVAILAELRAAFGILKPNAICEIDLTA